MPKTLQIVNGGAGRMLQIQEQFRDQLRNLSVDLENSANEVLETMTNTVKLTQTVAAALKLNHEEQARTLAEFLPQLTSKQE